MDTPPHGLVSIHIILHAKTISFSNDIYYKHRQRPVTRCSAKKPLPFLENHFILRNSRSLLISSLTSISLNPSRFSPQPVTSTPGGVVLVQSIPICHRRKGWPPPANCLRCQEDGALAPSAVRKIYNFRSMQWGL